MTFNRASSARISCASAADAIRLAAQLSKAPSWSAGGPPPDLVTANGAQVEAVWYSAPAVPVSSAVAAVTAARAPAAAAVTAVTHQNTASGGSITSRQF